MDKELAEMKFTTALEQQEPEFENFFLARFFDLQISYGDETCIVEVEVNDYMFNPQGSLHGGVISFILDVSMGHLCHKFSATAVTLEMKTQYLKAVKSGKVKCEARFLKKGKTLVYIESKMTDENDALIAAATATWYRL